MSQRTSEANSAIRKAWQREQELVSEGKGTRDWTEQQQKDILDPQKGKAYDEKGRAFEGQHMKSVEKYPEYQGDPDNIQFLTKDEHLEAHKGNWQNPTNWHYDPETKTYTEFKDDELIPCKAMELSQPVQGQKMGGEAMGYEGSWEKHEGKPKEDQSIADRYGYTADNMPLYGSPEWKEIQARADAERPQIEAEMAAKEQQIKAQQEARAKEARAELEEFYKSQNKGQGMGM
ncbi:MAG: hypothetical protein IJ071_11155 [Ruminococcus sp.]|nr:hypothetical protein [Ruminococcus sp.]